MPTGRNALHFGGIPLSDGVFAVVESSEIMVDDAEVTKSDLLMPISKEIEISADKSVGKRTFYLADTEAFEGPCCAIPDIGGPPNKYLVVMPRNEWKDFVIRWVEDPHSLDEMEDMDIKAEVETILRGVQGMKPVILKEEPVIWREKTVPLGWVARPKRPEFSLYCTPSDCK